MSISGISSNLTASAILNNTKTAQTNTETAAKIDTKDTIEKNKPDKNSSKLDFLKPSQMSDQMKKNVAIGAGVGAAVGGIAGGIAGYEMSWNKIKATNTVQSVSLNWQEPNMQPENLGKIPSDYYSWIKWTHTSNPSCNKDVIRNNPIMDNGQPTMHDVNQTFTNWGTPVVEWHNNDIKQQSLSGYNEHIYEDTHTERYTDSSGDRHSKEVVDGYWHRFSPNINSTTVGTYQSPTVKFETGVNVGLNTAIGAIGGAAIGAVAGGLAGAAITKAMEKGQDKA